jgi:tetratricopeptide (TPR) repeat protein
MKKPVILLALILASAYAFAQVAPDGEFYGSLGDFLLKNGHIEAALSVYEDGLKVEPGNKHILNNLGYLHKETNPMLAQDYFLLALQADPHYEKARSNLALLYHTNLDYDNAILQLKMLIEDHPDNINYHYDIAINYADRFHHHTHTIDDLDNSIRHFKIAYSLDKEFMYSLENIKVLEEIRGG